MRHGRPICSLAAVLVAGPILAEAGWQAKVDPVVLDSARVSVGTEFLVYMADQADVSGAYQLRTKREKGRFVFEELTRTAQRSQGPILEHLRGQGADHRSFWIANMIWVRGGLETVEEIASRTDVEHIFANAPVRMDLPNPSFRAQTEGVASEVPSNIEFTGAPSVFWSRGYKGQTVVVGGNDTGVDWEHPALRRSYRGWNGRTADHNYNWHDAIHREGGRCGADSKVPCDDWPHGTATMGPMVGKEGGLKIGMAPAARWIACRTKYEGVSTPATYSECFQWFIAPTDLNGRNPDPDRAPDVINNSWRCLPEEECGNPNAIQRIVKNVRAAGIVVVVAAGNEGPDCGTIWTPPGIYSRSLTVGATDREDHIIDFSSRGPVTVDGSNRLKPDISAPGRRIHSCSAGGGYGPYTGTSFAAPHVVGMVALILSAGACLRGDVDGIEDWLLATAEPMYTSESCGGVSGSRSPNNTYGYGVLRASLPDCRASPVGGLITGLEGRQVTCTNSTESVKVSIGLNGETSWDCESRGMPASQGDRVRILVAAEADESRAVGAVLSRLKPTKVICRNLTTKKRKSYKLKGTVSWDCQAKGLMFRAGDDVRLVIKGKVK